ncbi:hypothetical protein [Caldicellulosiruptor naganoensis]|uniref:REase associating with pPIWI RE domain-containing protein n=1 Tax=Caldicellulosiruptor naganoensis TaxID=29324 RepID=A0ABY7BGE3_9FIRM|nr:hypothetical protein [Caldicellulosiruptor naganoensis]WAM31649.1 hypothetical protein OTJ99_000080 [Caldicellulosiruptor naganoensis]
MGKLSYYKVSYLGTVSIIKETEEHLRSLELLDNNESIDMGIFLSMLRAYDRIAYADIVNDRIFAYLLDETNDEYIITENEWEEIKKKIGGFCIMTDVLDKARIVLLYPRKESKREKIEYETDGNKLCSVCGEKAVYKLSKTPVWICPRHYNQLLNRSLWDYIDRYLTEKDPIDTLCIKYKGKDIILETWFTEKLMENIQYYFRNAGFRNLRLDRELFLTVVRSCDGVVYANWIEDKLVTFRLPLHDCLITKQEWEEIKQRVIVKEL